MATFNQFNDLTNQLARGTHNFATNVYKVMLTNTAPVATNSVKADIVEIAAANGYVAGGMTLDGATLTQNGKQCVISFSDEVLTAAGGSIGPFRYVVLYNSTPAAGNLVGFYDYGSNITLNDTEPFTIDFGTNVLTIGSI